MSIELPENFKELIHKYFQGTASTKERKQINTWYASFNKDQIKTPSSGFDAPDIHETDATSE